MDGAGGAGEGRPASAKPSGPLAAYPPGTCRAAAYAARRLGWGTGCPTRPAPPTEAAGSHYTDCRLPASYDLSFSILINYTQASLLCHAVMAVRSSLCKLEVPDACAAFRLFWGFPLVPPVASREALLKFH